MPHSRLVPCPDVTKHLLRSFGVMSGVQTPFQEVLGPFLCIKIYQNQWHFSLFPKGTGLRIPGPNKALLDDGWAPG